MCEETKLCCMCGIEKNLDEFHNYAASKDGKQPKCKDCSKVYGQIVKHKKAPIREQNRLEKKEIKQKEISDRLASGLKTCSKCKETKSLSEFHKASDTLDGLRPSCKECTKKLNIERAHVRKDYYEKTKYKHKEYRQKYNLVNAERIAKRMEDTAEQRKAYLREYNKTSPTRKKYAEENKERAAANARAYRDKHGDRLNQYNREYSKINRGIINAKNVRYYASKKTSTPTWADLDKMKEIYKECYRLTKETGVRHNVDHIIPIQSKLVCGLHCEANLQILTKEDNLRKSNIHWPDMPT